MKKPNGTKATQNAGMRRNAAPQWGSPEFRASYVSPVVPGDGTDAATMAPAAAPSTAAPSTAAPSTAAPSQAAPLSVNPVPRVIGIIAIVCIAVAACVIGTARRIPPRDYLAAAREFENLQSGIDDVTAAYSQVGVGIISSPGSVTADTTSGVTAKLDELSSGTTGHADDDLFTRDAEAKSRFDALRQSTDSFTQQISGYMAFAPQLAAAASACSGNGVQLTTGDNVQFLADYASYLDACSAAVGALDEATDQQDASAWIDSANSFVSQQKETLATLQGMGSTSTMTAQQTTRYLDGLGTLAGRTAPGVSDTVTAINTTIAAADPSTALHELESYLYGKSASDPTGTAGATTGSGTTGTEAQQ